ncbi:MAG: alpha-amylase family glycosyl hydrolase, partial [Bacteroidota bacterium]|nr:alpha-amylase family glycosyl hydrolase [Bacteroidota bacterium]
MKTKFLYPWPRLLKNVWKPFLLFLLIVTAQRAWAQDPPQYGTPFSGVPNPADVNLYQVNIRPFSTAGNLAGVTARLDNIKAVGTNVIYLMPVYPHGTDSRSSVSPYSIKDFTSVGSEYGTLTDLRALVDGAHSRGMAVILDFVVNGTSWDHAWIAQHPDWYVRDGNGNIQQLATFPDVAALNFTSTAMRTAVTNAMRYWVFAANIDGFRCDFANNPPIDFWTQTISNLRSITTHNLLMFAEGDHQNLFQGGFDYSFGDQFYYNALKPIRKNGDNVANDITNSTNFEYANASGSNQVIRYTDNHDVDGSSDGNALTIFGGSSGVMANFVVCAYMRGVPFLYGSQEVAFNQQIFWPYTGVKIDWTQNANVTAEFTKVLNYRTSSTAIRRGAMVNYSDANVCAFTKISGTEKVVVLVNLRSSSSSYTIPSMLAGSYKDAYSGSTVTLTSGAAQNLAGFQYLVYTNANVTPVAVTGVTVSPTSATVSAGLTKQLTATIAPASASNTNVTWSSGNTAIATVSATGLV